MKNPIKRFSNVTACLITGFFCLFYLNTFSQNQKLSDSLEIVYNNKTFAPQDELDILRQLVGTGSNNDKKLFFCEKLIKKATELDSSKYIYIGYLQKGNTYRLKSDLTKALDCFFKATKIAVNANLIGEQASINVAIADAYSVMEDHDNAVHYYKTSLKLLKQQNDSISLASCQLNLGDEYFNQNKLDSALYYFNKSQKIFDALKFEMGIAYNLGNLGMIHAKRGENAKAEQNLNSAIETLTKFDDYYPISVYLVYLSDIYERQGNHKKAKTYALRSLGLAKKYGLKEQIRDADLKLSQLYQNEGKIPTAFEYYKNHIVYKDSVNSIKNVQQMANARTKVEVSKKQIEVDLLNAQKKTQKIIVIAIATALILLGLLALGLYKRNKFIEKTNKIIEQERALSDKLLLNILPKEIASELKESNSVKAKKFESVSILFTDFKSFTSYAEKLQPEELVKSIDYYFSKFDEIIEKYELEKIKTIGDSYMCAGGLSHSKNDHIKIVYAALEIIKFVKDTKIIKRKNFTPFDIRIGINTGPVVAGVVGTKKFAYDIWGDAVNVASRMESSALIGKINISENTYHLVKEFFKCTYRGVMEVKNRGKLKMYYVKGLKSKSELLLINNTN
jgi:class 3 adenylate cyclase